MSELCIDASVVVKLVLKGESHRVKARRLIEGLHSQQRDTYLSAVL